MGDPGALGAGALRGGGPVHGLEIAAPSGELLERGIGDRGEHQGVVLGQARRDRQQPGMEHLRLHRRDQHDEGAAAGAGLDRGRGALPVRLHQRRLHGRGRGDHVVEHLGAGGAEHRDVRDPVHAQQVHPVPGLPGQRRQQQRRVEGGIEPRRLAEASGGGARGVHHDQHVTVPLGPPGAHHHAAPARGRPPVDRADVVAVHEVAQGVELGALSALVDRGEPLDLPQPLDAGGEVLAGAEGVQGQHPSGRRDTGAAPGEAQRAERADQQLPGAVLAAPRGGEGLGDRAPLLAGQVEAAVLGGEARGRVPGVAHLEPCTARGGVRQQQASGDGAAQTHLRRRLATHPDPLRGRGGQRIGEDHERPQRKQDQDHPPQRPQHDHGQREQRGQGRARGERDPHGALSGGPARRRGSRRARPRPGCPPARPRWSAAPGARASPGPWPSRRRG